MKEDGLDYLVKASSLTSATAIVFLQHKHNISFEAVGPVFRPQFEFSKHHHNNTTLPSCLFLQLPLLHHNLITKMPDYELIILVLALSLCIAIAMGFPELADHIYALFTFDLGLKILAIVFLYIRGLVDVAIVVFMFILLVMRELVEPPLFQLRFFRVHLQ